MSLNPVRPQRVGNLRDRVMWQEKVGEEWQDRETEPARVEPLKGRELYEADASQRYATANYRVFLRYRHVPDTANWRVLWLTGHQVLNDSVPPKLVPERLVMDIEAAFNVDERRRFIELTVTNTNNADYPEETTPQPGELIADYTITAGEDSTIVGFRDDFVNDIVGSIDQQPTLGGPFVIWTVSIKAEAGAGEIALYGNEGAMDFLEVAEVWIDDVAVPGSWLIEPADEFPPLHIAVFTAETGFPVFVDEGEYTVAFREPAE